MITAKITFLLITILVAFSISRIKYSIELRIKEKIIILLLFTLALVLILDPKILDALASLLNIERGRDLLFYIFIPISTWIGIRNHIRINHLNKKINSIASNAALKCKDY